MNESHENQTSASRRQFLRTQFTATAAVAAGCISNNPNAGADEVTEQAASTDRTIRIGLVGCGGRGTGAANDSLTINEKVQLVAMADLEPEACAGKRDTLTKRHPGKVEVTDEKIYGGLDGYKRILDDPEIDLVLFATPPGFRPRHIAEAVDAGKHIFAEKPTCVDPVGYRICVAAHQKAIDQGTSIVTGTQYRRQSNYIAAVQKIRDGAIGDVISAKSRYCSNGIWYRNRTEGMSDLQYQLKNWMHFIWLSGDEIAEQAVHNIDAMNWVMGSAPESAYASGGRFNRPEDSEMWDAISVDYEYSGNRMLSFKCRQWPGATADNTNVIYGTQGTMHIGAASKGSWMLDRKGEKTWSADGSIADAYKQEHKDLVDSILADQPIVELEETAKSSLTAVMGRLAAYTGQRVDWDFVTEKSTLDLFPEDLTMDSVVTSQGHAIPGITKLI